MTNAISARPDDKTAMTRVDLAVRKIVVYVQGRKQMQLNIRQTNGYSASTLCNTGNSTKIDLIKQIRIIEGNYACFATAAGAGCSQGSCPWRHECRNVAQ